MVGVSVSLMYMSANMYAEADEAVLKSIALGKLAWPAADYLSNGRIHYRDSSRPPSVRRSISEA